MSKVYGYVTEKIIDMLKRGTIPWMKPLENSEAINYVSREPYKGINRWLLEKGGEYLTLNQIEALGGKLKESHNPRQMIVFYKRSEKKTKDSDSSIEILGDTSGGNKKEYHFMLRYYYVYHLDDVEGIESKLTKYEHNSKEEAEDILRNYKDAPQLICENLNRAFYSPRRDILNIPPIEKFKQVEKYYSVLFHEAVHSTGHIKRLGRFVGEAADAAFGSELYSKEELVAEIGAAMLCSKCGIETKSTLENSAAYVKSWIGALKNDPKMIVSAASKAEKAVKYITNEQDMEIIKA